MHKILIYLHIIHLLKSSSCFEHYPAHLQEVYVVMVYVQPLVSSLSAGDCPVHRLTGAQDSHMQRVMIPEAAYIYNYDVDLLKMNRIMLETCRGPVHKTVTCREWRYQRLHIYRVFNLKVDRIFIWVIYLLRFTTCYITQLTCVYSKCWKWCPFISMHLSTRFTVFFATFLSGIF